MQKHTCPLCGGKTIKDELFCRNCQDNAKKSEFGKLKEKPIDTKKKELLSQAITEPQPLKEEKTETKKSISRKHIAILGLIATCCALGGIGVYFYADQQNKVEEAYWVQCIDGNTSLGYADYLKLYPNGKFGVAAEERIRELKNVELSAWHALKSSDDIDALQTYLIEYPNTPYINDAKNRIDKLAWENAVRENTEDSYRAYVENVGLENYTGNFAQVARERHEYLRQLVILEDNEKDKSIKQIENIFRALAKKDFSLLASYLTPTPKTFLHMHDVSKDALIDSIKSAYKDDESHRSFSVLREGTSIVRDANNIQLASATVVEKKTEKDKKEMTDTLFFKLQLDESLKIISLEKSKDTF